MQTPTGRPARPPARPAPQAHSRPAPQAHSPRRGPRVLLTVIVAAVALAYALYSLTGLYVMAPKDSPPNGSTVWYYRRGSGLPFLSSPDSRRQARAAARSPELVALAPRTNWVIARFPFNRAVYLRTTGGVELLR